MSKLFDWKRETMRIADLDNEIKELESVLINTNKMKVRVSIQQYIDILYEEIYAIEEEFHQQEYQYFEELEAMYAVD